MLLNLPVLLGILGVFVDASKLEYRVAFVFAGSSRSLILPSVYLTIKKNLIESACPYPKCVGDVFARISTTDNVLAGMNSSGVTRSNAVSSVREDIVRAVSMLSKRGNYMLDWVDIGSEKENRYLSRFTTLRHKIFRTMDRRRYSMYGNRAAAFEMAYEREQRMNIKYTYVVHVRMDCAWFEPVPPLHTWYERPPTNIDAPASAEAPFNGVWVVDRWFYPPPDTFAVMPRQLSEEYFSLDNLVAPGVMCLGGPNFDPRLLNSVDLRQLGFAEEEYDSVKAAACDTDPLIKYINSFVNGKGIRVHFTGFSEAIYGRKLRYIGVSREHGSLKFRALPMAIVRFDGTRRGTYIQCTFLYKDFTFDFLRKNQTFPTSLLPACRMMEYLQQQHAKVCMRRAHGRVVPSSHLLSSSAVGTTAAAGWSEDMDTNIPHVGHDVNEQKVRSDTEPIRGSQAIVDKDTSGSTSYMSAAEELVCERSEFNALHRDLFAINTMPFNIHIARKNLAEENALIHGMNPSSCLGVQGVQAKVENCIRHWYDKKAKVALVYQPKQMFHFDPTITVPQMIYHVDSMSNEVKCLTLLDRNVERSPSSESGKFTLELQPCIMKWGDEDENSFSSTTHKRQFEEQFFYIYVYQVPPSRVELLKYIYGEDFTYNGWLFNGYNTTQDRLLRVHVSLVKYGEVGRSRVSADSSSMEQHQCVHTEVEKPSNENDSTASGISNSNSDSISSSSSPSKSFMRTISIGPCFVQGRRKGTQYHPNAGFLARRLTSFENSARRVLNG